MKKYISENNTERGYVLLMVVVFIGIFLTLATGLVGYSMETARFEHTTVASAQALAIAEAGIDLAAVRLDQNSSYTGENNTALGAGELSITVSGDSNTKHISATGFVPDAANPVAKRTIESDISTNTSVSFRYAVMAGTGGITIGSGSLINGDAYSGGGISGTGGITGNATVAGAAATPSITGVYVGGNALAHTLSDCTVTKDAYYQIANSCLIDGTRYQSAPDSPSIPLPITDAERSDWETLAATGGTISGPLTISDSETLGPQKISGDLIVDGTLTLSGPVWVDGNITFDSGARLTVAPATGSAGATLIADSSSDPSGSGTITVASSVTMTDNGTAGSDPLLVSTNTGAGAIDLSSGSAEPVILYAPYGTVHIGDNTSAMIVAGYGLSLGNNSSVTASSALPRISLYGGTSGTWQYASGTYRITH